MRTNKERFEQWCLENNWHPQQAGLFEAWQAALTYQVMFKVENVENYEELKNAAINEFRAQNG